MLLNTYHVNVTYKVYWSIFTQEFDIKFGFPRSDTCSISDTLNPECSNEERKKLETEKKKKKKQLLKAEAFRKKIFRRQARAGNIVYLSFSYMQNLPLPHLKTNAHNVFGVHDLGSDSVTMFTYHDGDGRKGNNKATSMLLTYINNSNEPLDNFILIDFSLIDKKKRYIESVKLPEEWDSIIQEARKKPSPFSVVNMHYRDFVNMKATMDNYFFEIT
ncbi:hypothetical protein PR048_010161 [Dryococelus australis]|uniref:Uncharacterized protein n=1 Tax=Dryococelus australis TaxID=614101 RepID=A0ABQ9I221_9NEOP|nr:hypothetical protein PR048_010161 [Dryococelus australis]